MNLQATEKIKVFIDKKYYGSKLEHTQVGKIPEAKRENLSWKGCYYTIEVGEQFAFDRGNDWDLSYFKLGNGAEFVIGCGNPKSFIEQHKVEIIK